MLFLTLAVIFAGLFAGYAARLFARRAALDPARLRFLLQRICLLGLMPFAFGASVWTLELSGPRLIALPLLGTLALTSGGAYAFLFARALKLGRLQRGVFIVSGSFTNIGAIGGLVVFAFFGESGFALMPFYKLFEELLYYGVGFPIAKSHAPRSDSHPSGAAHRLRALFLDPFILTALAGVGIGFTLNLSGLPRPDFFAPLNAVLIPLISFLLMVSIGLGMRFGALGKYLRPALAVAVIKFMLVPATVLSGALLLGFGALADRLTLKVALILAAGPCAFISMIPPALYRLDLDLANANWLLTNLLMLLVIPALWFAVGLF